MYGRQFSLLSAIAMIHIAGCANPHHQDAAENDLTPRGYICYYARGTVTVDGRLDDAAWNDAPWSEEFVDIRGDDLPAPRHKTRVKMLWDATHLYVAAELSEPHVIATLQNHDDIVFHDNDFELFVDPDGDCEKYAEVEINALGTIFDLLLDRTYIAQKELENAGVVAPETGPAHHDWNFTGIRSAVHVEGTINNPSDVDHGWSVEFALPWSVFDELTDSPCPPRDRDQWRINFSRVQWQTRVVNGRYEKVPNTPEDNWVWSPQGVINMHVPEQWGYVVFSEVTRQVQE